MNITEINSILLYMILQIREIPVASVIIEI